MMVRAVSASPPIGGKGAPGGKAAGRARRRRGWRRRCRWRRSSGPGRPRRRPIAAPTPCRAGRRNPFAAGRSSGSADRSGGAVLHWCRWPGPGSRSGCWLVFQRLDAAAELLVLGGRSLSWHPVRLMRLFLVAGPENLRLGGHAVIAEPAAAGLKGKHSSARFMSVYLDSPARKRGAIFAPLYSSVKSHELAPPVMARRHGGSAPSNPHWIRCRSDVPCRRRRSAAGRWRHPG